MVRLSRVRPCSGGGCQIRQVTRSIAVSGACMCSRPALVAADRAARVRRWAQNQQSRKTDTMATCSTRFGNRCQNQDPAGGRRRFSREGGLWAQVASLGREAAWPDMGWAREGAAGHEMTKKSAPKTYEIIFAVSRAYGARDGDGSCSKSPHQTGPGVCMRS